MNYAATQRNTLQTVVGFLLVLALHVLLFYALAHGLGQRLVEAVSTPMQVTLIPEQVKPLPRYPSSGSAGGRTVTCRNHYSGSSPIAHQTSGD
jgi:hypothetical protein